MWIDTYLHAKTGVAVHFPAGSSLPPEFLDQPLQLLRQCHHTDDPKILEAIHRKGWSGIKTELFFYER